MLRTYVVQLLNLKNEIIKIIIKVSAKEDYLGRTSEITRI